MVIIEAFSMKKAVISRDRGAMASMIDHCVNGMKYENLDDFVEAIEYLEENPEITSDLGQAAFKSYQEKYTEEMGYKNLMNLYSEVISQKEHV